VPTRIEGTFHVLPRGAVFPKFRPIKIIFGCPVQASDLMPLSLQEEGTDPDRAFAETLRERVELLV
jgi:hypothetical protein